MPLYCKTVSLILLLLANAASAWCQPELKPKVILDKLKADCIAVDAQGNIYSVEDSKLSKYSPEGALLATFNRFSLGAISTVDVSNSMKIMLFYKEAGTILFLDDKLSPITEELSLFAKNLYAITLASYSTTNHIWLYDYFSKELLTLDFRLNIIQKNRFDLEEPAPVRLTEIKEKMLLLQHPAEGLLLFDAFGTFVKKVAIFTHSPVQVVNTTIYFLEDGEYYQYDYQKLEKQRVDFQMDNVMQIIKYRDRHVVLTIAGTVAVY
jgi:hypothetical protein